MKERIGRLIAWAKRTKPARVWARYGTSNGPLLGQGLSYQSIFAAFAAIWVAFAGLGFWIRGNPPLQDAIVDTISTAVPGLIDQGEGGAISIDALLSLQILGWTGVIAAVGLVWTAIAWFASARTAIRSMLGQVGGAQNPIILKLKDAGLALGFGIAVIVSGALSLFSTSLLGSALQWLGMDAAHPVAIVASRLLALVILLALNAGILWALYAVLSTVRLPRGALLQGTLGGAVVLGVLETLGSALLGGATSNPLLASFAVIIGLMIWFNLICMVLLLAAAWIGETIRPTLEPGAVSEAPPRGDVGRAL